MWSDMSDAEVSEYILTSRLSGSIAKLLLGYKTENRERFWRGYGIWVFSEVLGRHGYDRFHPSIKACRLDAGEGEGQQLGRECSALTWERINLYRLLSWYLKHDPDIQRRHGGR